MKTLEKDNSIDGFRALGDPIRLAILVILETGTRCVCDIQSSLSDVAPNLLSHHLRVLREAGLVQVERRGRWMDGLPTRPHWTRTVEADDSEPESQYRFSSL